MEEGILTIKDTTSDNRLVAVLVNDATARFLAMTILDRNVTGYTLVGIFAVKGVTKWMVSEHCGEIEFDEAF